MKRKTVVLVLVLLLAAGGLAIGNYVLNRPPKNGTEEMRRVRAEVGKLTILPQGEDPALATITDPSKLHHQKFFDGSQKGDKVLIYSEHNKVYLYRPSSNKIVNIGPVEIDSLPTSTTPKN